MTNPNPAGRPSESTLERDRQRLAELVGRLLARRWLRERGLLPDDWPSRPTESRPKPLRPLDDKV
jgi:hypothetical protein